MARPTIHDLYALEAPWRDAFGEDLAIGFPIGPVHVPMLRRCLAAGSRAELEAFLAAPNDDEPADAPPVLY